MYCSEDWYHPDVTYESEDPYDGLTLDDVLDDEEKEEVRAYKAKEHIECSLSMDSLGISYRD